MASKHLHHRVLRENVHPKIVSARLGRATVGITLDTYSHVLPNLHEEAARESDALLARTGSHADPEPKILDGSPRVR